LGTLERLVVPAWQGCLEELERLDRRGLQVLTAQWAPQERRDLLVYLDQPEWLDCLVQVAALEHQEQRDPRDLQDQLDRMVQQELRDQQVHRELQGCLERREVLDLLEL